MVDVIAAGDRASRFACTAARLCPARCRVSAGGCWRPTDTYETIGKVLAGTATLDDLAEISHACLPTLQLSAVNPICEVRRAWKTQPPCQAVVGTSSIWAQRRKASLSELADQA